MVLMDEFKLLLRIVYECTEVALLFRGERGDAFSKHRTISREKLGNTTFDTTRSIAEHMEESLVLTMEISEEMLSRFWQIENGLEIDDLGGHLRDIGKLMSEKAQIAEIGQFSE